MGRPFKIELDDLRSTYQHVFDNYRTEVLQLSDFLMDVYDQPLLIVGSGGSYSVAKAFEYLHTCSQLPGVARAVTPLELSNMGLLLRKSGVILITSNGNNNDTVNAYNYINRCCPMSFLTLCLNKESKIKKLTDGDSNIFVGDRLPRGKDGYLAVNSILAFVVIISRAYNIISKTDQFSLPGDFSSFHFQDIFGEEELQALKKESQIVLFGDFATPVAFDIESKFSEVALGNVLLSDYRNFAHGRHFWLSHRASLTSIISLVTPENRQLFLKTLELVPTEIPNIIIETESLGAKGMLELFLSSFYLIGYAGMQAGIDPGKPKVPDFGKKMYHISHMPEQFKMMKMNDNLANRSAFRKCGFAKSPLFDNYRCAFLKFKTEIESVCFREIVFDYDATLVEKGLDISVEKDLFEIINRLLEAGVGIKIATGRGKSVRLELKEKIPHKYWKNVIIGYYNGGIIAPLSDDGVPNPNCKENILLVQLADNLKSILPNIDFELRPQQLTVMMDDCDKFIYKDIIFEISHRYKGLKILMSGHSIDIIPLESSKLNLLDASINALCIGDSGQYGGNDYELLSSTYSLSVNRVSSSISSCWNYSPIGIYDTRATLYYLKQLQINDHCFVIKVK